MGVGGTGRGRTAAKMGGERLDPIHSQLELCLKLWGPVGLPEHLPWETKGGWSRA